MRVEAFHEPQTGTLTYLVYDESTCAGVVIDPILDFEPESKRLETDSADRLVALVEERGIDVQLVIDTHLHADHLSAVDFLRDTLDAVSVAGVGLPDLQAQVLGNSDLDARTAEPRIFDRTLCDGEHLDVGNLRLQAIHAPGHTPACTCFLIEDALFVGDVLLHPQLGTARCDFPGGSAETLYESVQRLFRQLDPATRVFTGHDYPTPDRPLCFESTLGYHRLRNIQISEGVTRTRFIETRSRRDETLAEPSLMKPSLEWNVSEGGVERVRRVREACCGA